MSGQSIILAVDQSTSGTKALAFDAEGRRLGRVTIAHEQFYPAPGLVEHDPEEILAATRRAVAELVAALRIDPADIAALALTNQRETVVAWDAQTGRPLHRALVWQDARGRGICEELAARKDCHSGKNAGLGQRVKDITGLPLDPMFSASKLAWLVANDADAKACLDSGRLMAGTIDSWLIWKLTGKEVFACDLSNASRTMLLDIHRLSWSAEILELFGLSGIRLPEPRLSDAGFGEAYFPELGRKIPIAAVMGDSHAALFGHGARTPGSAKSGYGTGSSVMSYIGPDPGTSPSGIVLSLGWGFRGSPAYVYEGNIQSTGDTMRWLRDNLGLFQNHDEAEAMAESVSDTAGIVLVPSFSGLGAPHWAATAGALIVGMPRGSDKRHLVRAGLESIAYQVAELVTEMDRLTGTPLRSLMVDGGPTRNRFLMQFQADILGIPVIVPETEEIPALGAALMAAAARGLGDPDALSRNREQREYLPRMQASRREALLSAWCDAVCTAIDHQTIRARDQKTIQTGAIHE